MSDYPEHSGADVLVTYLISTGIVSTPGTGRPWPLFTNAMPELPVEAAVIFNTEGEFEGRIQQTGKMVEHPGFQVRLRVSNDRLAAKKASEISQKLDAIKRTIVRVQTKDYIVHAVTRRTPLIPIGQEEGGGRLLYTLNGTINYGEKP